ncbi:MAG TPA: hypothetical protein VF244_01455 [Acidimicrobiales bacterium]
MEDVRSSRPAAMAGLLTVGAGLVHAAAAGTHSDEPTLVKLFAATALVQVIVGALAVFRPSRRVVALAALLGGAAVATWILSRTTGVPFIASLSEPEAVGLQDLMATVMEAAAVVVAAAALHLGPRAGPARLSPLWLLALSPTLVGMTASHVHSTGHDHMAAGGHDVHVGLAADPIFSGADTSSSSEAELLTAANLVLRTREAVRSRFPSEAAVIAAGYTSIGDGFPFSSFEHFVHSGYIRDGYELDPDRIESIVVESTPTGKWVVSAMYILEPGRTLANAPGQGALMTWHEHQNICWDATGTRIAGFVHGDGVCHPSGTFRVTPPMLHVWMRDHECGPFAGIEGHGATTCAHTH